jgi:hypothetical protein
MPRSYYFYQPCPTCGRSLQVRVEFLGRKVACVHCRGEFLARDPDSRQRGVRDGSDDVMQRANALLDSARLRTPQARRHAASGNLHVNFGPDRTMPRAVSDPEM